jgi:pimeloyl-ACP methyl ester carboxylesterase
VASAHLISETLFISGVGGSAGEWAGVRDLLPSSQARVIGHSQGAIEAMRLAAAEPHRFDRLILTGGFFPPSRGGRSLGPAALHYGRHRLAYLRELRARATAPAPSVHALVQMSAVARLGLRPSAFHRLAAAVRCPVLVVHGTDDHVVPIVFARAAAGLHPRWEFCELQGSGHHPHRDEPSRWAAAVTRS